MFESITMLFVGLVIVGYCICGAWRPLRNDDPFYI